MADQSETLHFVDSSLVRLLPAGASLKGTIHSDTPQQLLLEGRFAGHIELPDASRVVIDRDAEVDVETLLAHTVVLRGRVNGQIHAQVIEIACTARVSGAIRYEAELFVEPGARIRAQIEGPAP